MSKNIWEWPRLRGEIPPVYDKCLSIIHEDTVFLSMRGNLHILDMETMVWSKVHVEEYLNFTRWYSVTITKVSQSTATLIGESGDLMTCWLLDLKKAKQFMEPSSIWTKLLLPLPVISKFAAVLEPTGQELLLIGGMQTTDSLQFPRSMSSNVLKIQTRIPTLMSLAIDCAARSTCTFDQTLQSDQLPAHLQHD